MMVRQSSIRSLVYLSTIIVLGSLYLMWYGSRNHFLTFLNASNPTRISFDIKCNPDINHHHKLTCDHIYKNSENGNAASYTTTDVLLNLMTSKKIFQEDQANQFTNLLMNLMLSGMPMVGLDDYVVLSDLVNENIGESGRDKIFSCPGYNDRFGNFLNVRKNQLRIVSGGELSILFMNYLQNISRPSHYLDIKLFPNMKSALFNCCETVWAVIEIEVSPRNTECLQNQSMILRPQPFCNRTEILQMTPPSVTIRMHPGAIPDTRNFEWSPLKRNAPQQESGQILYFISGFLSLQMEIQNFFSTFALDAEPFPSNVLRNQKETLKSLFSFNSLAKTFATSMIQATNLDEIQSILLNTSSSDQLHQRPNIFFPLFHRAFPVIGSKQPLYWHGFGSLITIALIVFFSLPPAMCVGAFRKEYSGGQLDVLSTMPGIKKYHSILAWIFCSACWSFISFLSVLFFFYNVMDTINPMIPSLGLLLFSLALAPMAMILGEVIRSADTIVVAVPTLVFVTLLPGLLYFDLAFDVQRHVAMELIMSLFPASAVAICLRFIFALKAASIPVEWTSPSPIAGTPLYFFFLALTLDICIYTFLAVQFSRFKGWTWKSCIIFSFMNQSSVHHVASSLKEKTLISDSKDENYFDNLQTLKKERHFTNVAWQLMKSASFYGYRKLKTFFQWMMGYQLYVVIPTADGDISQPHCKTWESYQNDDESDPLLMPSIFRIDTDEVGDVVLEIDNLPAIKMTDAISNRRLVSPFSRKTKYPFVKDDRQHNDEISESSELFSMENAISSPYINENASGGRRYSKVNPSGEIALKICHLTKQYQTSGNVGVVVLSDLSANLYKKKVTVLLGSNGAGKSTLMRIVSELDSDYSGVVQINEGNEVNEENVCEGNLNKSTRKLGFCPQIDPLFEQLTVEEHFHLFLDLLENHSEPQSNNKKEKIDWITWFSKCVIVAKRATLKICLIITQWLESLPSCCWLRENNNNFENLNQSGELRPLNLNTDSNISSLTARLEQISAQLERLDMTMNPTKRITELSGGMKRRLSLALSFIGTPKILILDEPTSGCDSWTRVLIRKEILAQKNGIDSKSSRKNRGCAVLVSTHHVDDIEILADRVWFLNERFLEFDGSIAELNAQSNRKWQSSSPEQIVTNDLICNQNIQETVETKSDHNQSVEFTTWNEVIQLMFINYFPLEVADRWRSETSTLKSNKRFENTTTWIIPADHTYKLMKFIEHLEAELHCLDWSLQTTNAYGALCRLYTNPTKAPAVHTLETPQAFQIKSRSLLSSLDYPHSSSTSSDFLDDINSSSYSTISIASQTQLSQSMLASDLPTKPYSLTNPYQFILSFTFGCIPSNFHQEGRFIDNFRRFFCHLYALMWLRYIELVSNLSNALLVVIIIPFVIVLAIVYGCSDIKYPKALLSKRIMKGVGEVPLSEGISELESHVSANLMIATNHPSTVPSETEKKSKYTRKGESPNDRFLIGSLNENQSRSQIRNYNQSIAELFNNHLQNGIIVWKEFMNSNTMWLELFLEYFHHSRPRWGSIVLQDTVDKWIESNVFIDRFHNESINAQNVYEKIVQIQDTICGRFNGTNSEKNQMIEKITKKSTQIDSNVLWLCGDASPVVKISLVEKKNETLQSCNQKKATALDPLEKSFYQNCSDLIQSPRFSLSITSYQNLVTNLTLLTNFTSDHATPVFLKNVVPTILRNSITMNQYNTLPLRTEGINALSSPQSITYHLYSHPLPEINLTSILYLERGYLGSTIIVLYMLITTITCVRFITHSRKSGMKLQLQLSSMSRVSYWIGNYVFDYLLVMITLLSTMCAVLFGGDPIYQYFFAYPPFPGGLILITILLFSGAMVSASYTFSVLSNDQLTSQLFNLITSVTFGIFLKLYLDRQHDPFHITFASICRWTSPSFAFSTALFDMFHYYTIHLQKSGTTTKLVDTIRLANLQLHHIHQTLLILSIQSCLYLILCIIIDASCLPISIFISKVRWYYSRCLDLSSTTARNNPLNQSDPSVEESKIFQKVVFVKENSVGIFPFIDNHDASFSGNTVQSYDLEDAVGTSPMQSQFKPKGSLVGIKDLFVDYPAGGTYKYTKHRYDQLIQLKRLALCNLSLDIYPGQRVALMGMNGGGKSTLFKTLAANQNIPLSGMIKLDMMDTGRREMDWSHGEMGYVPQDGGLYEFLTVNQHIQLFQLIKQLKINAIPTGSSSSSSTTTGTATMTLIPMKYYSYPVHALSGGTKKKLLVQISNQSHPKVLLLDECTTGVDPLAAEKIVHYLKSLDNQTQSILFASHRIEESVMLCDRVIMLQYGQKYLDCSMEFFIQLAYQYYQVDILLWDDDEIESSLCDHPAFDMDKLQQELTTLCHVNMKRSIVYSPCHIRITIEKMTLPLSFLWKELESWKRNRNIRNYCFRNLDLEEALAIMIDSSSN